MGGGAAWGGGGGGEKETLLSKVCYEVTLIFSHLILYYLCKCDHGTTDPGVR